MDTMGHPGNERGASACGESCSGLTRTQCLLSEQNMGHGQQDHSPQLLQP